MRTFVVTLAITLLLVVSVSILNAQEMEKEMEVESTTGQMPMMQGMMGGQGGMMQGSMMGRGMMSQTGSGMMCPMCGKMMQGGMMGQMPMMQGMMGGQGSMMDMEMPNAQKLLALTDDLKLKDEQIKSLKTLSLNSQKESIRKKADLAVARIELNFLLGTEEIDLVQMQQKVREVANLEAELKIAHIKASIEAKEILTMEQRTLLKEIAKKEAQAGKKPAAQETKETTKPMRQAMEYEMHH